MGAERAWWVVAVGGGASAFDALADDTRRTVLSLLREHGELTVTQLAGHIDHIGRTAVSMQLKVLREAGMVQERPAGKYRYYSLRVEPINDVVAFLSTLYGASLDGLATITEKHRDPEAEQRRWGTSY
ncbi:metalloregulator ArsR/SmtB family transcription factor [Crossiella sp. CA-258035]|uniref:ArsR/SmtB family transcription factor n=1 Tax=Crossiella sp. CA-258035 TaxID=2981138 RepID=UPI0024BBEFCA|nr:metalloregulator ArsR/SmtB family transcription factor [Crossiella sp. CA-258035]WHT23636.1 metalloregulator ArsR/SmtB family transcription factor [Crossiella sp. CA-258035]